MELVQDKVMHLVLNTDMHHYGKFRRHKLAQVLEHSQHSRGVKIVAVVWECNNRGLANLQAELLWDKGLPVRVVENDVERDQFIREIVASKYA